MAALTPQQQYERSQADKVEHSTQATTSQTTSEANSQSQVNNETPTQSANEAVIKEDADYGNYSEPTDFSFLDEDKNGTEFQIGEDIDKGYNRDMYEYAKNYLEEHEYDIDDYKRGIQNQERLIKEYEEDIKNNPWTGPEIPEELKDLYEMGVWEPDNAEDDRPNQIKLHQKFLQEYKDKLEKALEDQKAYQEYVDYFKDMYNNELAPVQEKLQEEIDYDNATNVANDARENMLKAQKAATELSLELTGEAKDWLALEQWVKKAKEDSYYIRDVIGKLENEILDENYNSLELLRDESKTLSDGSTIYHNKDGSWTIELPNGNEYTSIKNFDKDGTNNEIVSILSTDGLETGNYNSAYEQAIKNRETYYNNAKKINEAIKNAAQAEADYDKSNDAIDEALDKYNKAKNTSLEAKENKLKELYESGKLSPVEYANALRKAQEESGIVQFIGETKEQEFTRENKEEIQTTYDNWYAEHLDKLNKIDTNSGLEVSSNEISENIDSFVKTANKELIELMGDFTDWTEDKYKEFYNSKEFDGFRNEILQYGQAAKEKINQIRTEAEKQGYSKEEGKLKQIRYNAERALNKIKVHTKLSEDDAYNVDSWLRSLDASENVAESLIASAAWNGAEDIKGSEYVENWKDEVNQFFNEKSILATGARGALGLLAATVGFGLLAINPALAIITIGVGAATFGSSSVKAAIGQEQEKSSTRDIIFNPDKKKSIELYNQLYAPYNIGDTKAVSTYTETAATAIEAANGLASLISNPLGGAIMLADAGKKAKRLLKGGTDAKLDEMYQNVFNAAVYFDNAFGTDLESRFDINIEENTDDDEKTTSSSFDIDTDSIPVEGKYSGYRENAKNSNIAKNYNAGMEEESNEVVSDKYCKIFKTMLNKEPDYIRKVLIAIPKNHAESEW